MKNVTLGWTIIIGFIIIICLGFLGNLVGGENEDYSNRELIERGQMENRSTYSDSLYDTQETPNTGNVYQYKSGNSISNDSYNEGYDSVYMDEDYDEDRYDSDRDYANGVDDAIDEWEEDERDW